MHKHLLVGASLVLLPAIASAQGATTPVRVSVIGAVQLTRIGTDITDFGPVPNQAQTKTINPAAPTGAQRTAGFVASGSPGATILVNFSSSLDLCHETAGCGATTRIVFSPDLAHTETCFQPVATSIASGGSGVLNGNGDHCFYLGGSITVPANPTPGVYSGVFTLSAAYQ